MLFKVSVLVALAVAVSARPETPSYSPPSPSYNAPAHPSPSYSAPIYNDVPAHYNTQYAVSDEYSGNNFGHQEDRDGYKTQGTYYVQLPDGRLQKVTYYVDGESGFVAEVTYEGEAQYPAYQPALSPSYA